MKKTVLLIFLFLAGCAPGNTLSEQDRQVTLASIVLATDVAMTQMAAVPTNIPENRITPSPLPEQSIATSTAQPSSTPDLRLAPKYWSEWPIVPTVSGTARQIYEKGISGGNDPRVYSTVGDCQSEPNVFLGIYATDRYYLGDGYDFLKETIGYYQASFSVQSQGVRDGLSAPSALSPTWADKEVCKPDENPVECELRIRKPSIVFINLGTNWKPGASAEKYEEYLRQVVQIVVDHGALPVLSTKADNIEGDHSLNRATAQIAYEFDIPLWNFWKAAQSLPNNGLDGERDNIYLTPDGWNRRNFTALQTLDALRRSLQGLPPPPGI